MLTHNYRILRDYDKEFGGHLYKMVCVYYVDDKLSSFSYTDTGSAETREGIYFDVLRLNQALSLPTLHPEDFPDEK
jgi:hypothetical protein